MVYGKKYNKAKQAGRANARPCLRRYLSQPRIQKARIVR